MSATTIAVVLGLLIAVICLADAYRWNKKQVADKGPLTLYRFFLYDGKLNYPQFSTALVAANLSLGNFIIFIATWGYNYGAAGLICFIINLGLNVAGFLYFFPKFEWYIEKHENNGTIHDYLSRAYGGDPLSAPARNIRLTASIVTIIGLTLAIVFELSLAVSLLKPQNSLDQIKLFAALLILIAVFTSYGGFRTLFVSDFANASVLTIATCLIIGFIFYYSGTSDAPLLRWPSSSDFVELGWPSILSIMIIGSGWMLVAMDQWQRTCASRSFDTSARAMIPFFIVLTIFAIAFALWGAFDKAVLPSLVTETVKNGLSGAANPLMDISAVPVTSDLGKWFVSFAVAGLVFAAISTTNTFLNVCSHSFTTDVLVGTIANRPHTELTNAENELYVGVARAVIICITGLILVCFVVTTLADMLKDPLSFFYIAYSIQFALLAPMVFSACRRRPSANAALLSIIVGFATSLLVGIGSWFLLQAKAEPILFVAPADWIALTPVVTLMLGSLPLVLMRRSQHAQ